MSKFSLSVVLSFIITVCLLPACGGGSTLNSYTPPAVEEPEAPEECVNQQFNIVSASDDGAYDASYTPSKAIDGDTDPSSRWSSLGEGKTLLLDMGTINALASLKMKWYSSTERQSYFEIETSSDNVTWQAVLENGVSSGEHDEFEQFNLTASDARYIKIIGLGNENSDWNSLIEVEAHSCEGTIEPTIPTVPTHPTPGVFDMSDWDVEGSDPWVGDTMEFDALREQHVTPNGSGWRHELKIKSEKRVAMTAVYEDFQADIKIEMSHGSKTIVAQHHAGDTGTIMKLYVSDSSETGFSPNSVGLQSDSKASNGIFDVYVRLAREDGSGEDKQLLSTVMSGETFNFRVINDHGIVTVFAFGESFSRTVEDSATSYLKFGNYLQAQDPYTRVSVEDSDDWAQFYADQGIVQSLITFSNVSYLRVVD